MRKFPTRSVNPYFAYPVRKRWVRSWLRDTLIDSFRWVFFFQAEDGIRDRDVTGVQTCALPILRQLAPVLRTDDFRRVCAEAPGLALSSYWIARHAAGHLAGFVALWDQQQLKHTVVRSEERRVGKECRARTRGADFKTKESRARG